MVLPSLSALMLVPWARAAPLYLLLYAGVTFPLLLHPHDMVIANHGDGFNDMLWFWYARTGQALQPHTDSLFFPWGVPLAADKGFWLVPYLSVPLQFAMPLPLVFNVLSCTFFVATATALFSLARLTGARSEGAWIAGALFVLSPPYLCEMSQGILEQMWQQWLIAFISCGVQLRDPNLAQGDRLALRAGLYLTAAVLTSWYNALNAALFCLILPVRRLVPGLLLAAAVLGLPLLVGLQNIPGSTTRYNFEEARETLQGQRPVANSATVAPAAVSVPDMETLARGSVDVSVLLARTRPFLMRDALPGFLLLSLGLLGAWRRGRASLPWLLVAGLFAVLSLGPHLIWQGKAVCALPTEWLYYYFPPLIRARPVRFLMPLTMIIALLASHALPALSRPTQRGGLAAILVALQLCEVFIVQKATYRLPLASARVPAFYHRLSAEPSGAVIEVPLLSVGVQVGKNHFYQTVHGHPMLNYDFIRPERAESLRERAAQYRVLGMLMDPGVVPAAQDAEHLRRLGFRYVILHTCVEATPLPPGPVDMNRLQMFSGALLDGLRALYGEPSDEGDGILVFDMNNIREQPRGQIRPFRNGIWRGTVEPDASVLEVRAWVRGRGAALAVSLGAGRRECSPRLQDDSWHWVRIRLASPPPGSVVASLEQGPAGAQACALEMWTSAGLTDPKGPGVGSFRARTQPAAAPSTGTGANPAR